MYIGFLNHHQKATQALQTPMSALGQATDMSSLGIPGSACPCPPVLKLPGKRILSFSYL